jgi:hypothetical protein
MEVLRSAGRRWYVLVAGLLLTGGLAILVLRFVPLTYDAKASVLLLPPANVVTDGGNPFLNLGGLDVVAGVLSKSLTDTSSVNSIIPKSSHAKYTVEPDPTVSGSVLLVTATDRSSDGAFAVLDQVLALAKTRLQTLQNSVDAKGGTQVRMMVITNNTVADPNTSTLVRTLIVVVAVGLVLTALLAVSIDALARRRSSRKAARNALRRAKRDDAAEKKLARSRERKPRKERAPDAVDTPEDVPAEVEESSASVTAGAEVEESSASVTAGAEVEERPVADREPEPAAAESESATPRDETEDANPPDDGVDEYDGFLTGHVPGRR